jgi:hypothetical protein
MVIPPYSCPLLPGFFILLYAVTWKEVTEMRNAYKAAIARMLKNIQDEKTLALIYKYILYLYTRNR